MHRRFAIYYAPPAQGALARLGAAWLGRDAQTGAQVAQPSVPDLAALTEAPRRYGLHGTLKPPLRLAEGCGPDDLLAAVTALAACHAPVPLGRLRVARLGGFLALVPERQPEALEALAAEVVTALDRFRAPASEGELARRRAAGLTERQEALLVRWGYPYVMEELRFHVTLTGRLPPERVAEITAAADAHFAPALDEDHAVSDLAVFGEDASGVFHLLTRAPLTG